MVRLVRNRVLLTLTALTISALLGGCVYPYPGYGYYGGYYPYYAAPYYSGGVVAFGGGWHGGWNGGWNGGWHH